MVVYLDLGEVCLLVVADFDRHLDIAVQYIVVRFPIETDMSKSIRDLLDIGLPVVLHARLADALVVPFRQILELHPVDRK